MSLRPPRDLLAIPHSLRSLLITRLLSPPCHTRSYSTAPPPARESLLGLWASPSINLAPPPNPFALPTPTFDAVPADLRTASDFFLKQKPNFIYSAVDWRSHQVNYYVPEICVLGCSNAGKSTFINALLGMNLARSSSRPGSTREMNAYATGPIVKRKVIKNKNAKTTNKMDLLRSLVLMDTPGYGFNSVKEWGKQIEEYLERRTMLKGVVLLLRSDIPLTKWDVEVLEFLAHHGKKTAIFLTRADRCGEDKWLKTCVERCEQVRELLEEPPRKSWPKGDWTPDFCVTAAGMANGGFVKRGKLKKTPAREEAGMGGARIAVLKLAGLLGEEAEKKKKEPAPEPWVGKTVSWDSIPVKGAA